MDAELSSVFETLTRAFAPEDVFGPLEGGSAEEREEALDRSYKRLARACHPDRFEADPEARELAHDAFRSLGELRRKAQAKLARGSYGVREAHAEADPAETTDIVTPRRTYRVALAPFCQGDLALLYRGRCLDGDGPEAQVVAKLAREPEDNDLVRNEIRVLDRLWAQPSPLLKHLPVLLDRFSSEGRQGLVLRELDAVDLTVVHERYPQGLDPQHAGWILARALSALGFAHSRGVVHGNLEPAHVMVRARDHNVFLVDWSYAAVEPGRSGEGFRIHNETYSPPEVAQRKPPIPASDLYALGRSLVFLLGGDPVSGTVPDAVPDRLQRFLQFLTLPGSRNRAQDAWEALGELKELRRALWGEPRFAELRI